jgi:pectate lyase
VGQAAERGLQLVSDRFESSTAALPSSVLQKTATRITFSNGTVQEGWKLTIIGALQGSSSELTELVSVNIPEVPGEGNEGYYLPWEMKGVVTCADNGLSSNVINVLQNGAELQDSLTNNGNPTDSIAILESTTDAQVDFTLSVVANPSGVGANATGTVIANFEFLCYEGVVPTIV